MTLRERNPEHVPILLILSAPREKERQKAVSLTCRREKIPLGLSPLPCVQTTLSPEPRGGALTECPNTTDLGFSLRSKLNMCKTLAFSINACLEFNNSLFRLQQSLFLRVCTLKGAYVLKKE